MSSYKKYGGTLYHSRILQHKGGALLSKPRTNIKNLKNVIQPIHGKYKCK